MFAFVAREPILDKNKEVFAYELLFRDGHAGTFPSHDKTKQDQIADRFYTLGLDDISGQKASIINFTPQALKEGLPDSLSSDRVIIALDSNLPDDAELVETVEKLRDQGFRIAIDDPLLRSTHHPMFALADIIKVDISKLSKEQLEKALPRLAANQVKLVAEHVGSHDDFSLCEHLGFDLFQGYFFAEAEGKERRNLPASKMNLVDLIGESAKQSFDFERVNQIIERDAALSFLLLKFINNPTVNKKQKITSLRHALNYMGEMEIKKFIALLSLANLSDDKPIEIIHMSLVRAKFFELLSVRRKQIQDPPISFLIGLFSLLESLLDQAMPDILEQLPLDEVFQRALLGQDSEFNNYLSLVKAFESAIWLTVIKQSRELDIDQKDLHSLYNEAIVWGNSIRQTISSHFPRRIAS